MSFGAEQSMLRFLFIKKWLHKKNIVLISVKLFSDRSGVVELLKKVKLTKQEKKSVTSCMKDKKIIVKHFRDVVQPGRALAWGARSRRFKSSRPDQIY